MKKILRPTRRSFLRSMLAAAAAPLFLPARVLGGEEAPSRKIQLGHIGVGGQGTANMRNFLGVSGASSIALCDPFQSRREKAAAFVLEAQGHTPKLYNDFRELLADPAVDAVIISTPDHWHVPVALAAIRAGKDVYLEKPLGYSLEQNRLLRETLASSGRVFQYGTQQRNKELIKRGVELVRNGYIGDLQRIEAWSPGGRSGGSTTEIPVPPGLDYDLYLGPAPLRPCTSDRITSAGSWHCSDYAIGFIAGWGAHPLDVAIWGMHSDTKGPFKIKGTGVFPPASDLFNCCKSWDVDIQFADGVSMHFMSADVAEPFVAAHREKTAGANGGAPRLPGNGTTFYGSKGWVSLSRDTCEASTPDWLRLKQCEGTDRVVYHKNFYRAFVESVRNRNHFVAPINDAVRSDALSHLSLLAIQSGQTVVWDPKAYAFTDPVSLNSALSRPIRGDWLGSSEVKKST